MQYILASALAWKETVEKKERKVQHYDFVSELLGVFIGVNKYKAT